MSKRFILLVLLYWIMGVNLITVYLLSSIEMFVEISAIDINALSSVSNYWLSGHQYLESSLFGFLFALLFLFIHQLTERREIGRMSFGKIILVKSALYVGGSGLIFFIIYFIMVIILAVYPEDTLAMFSVSKATIISTGSL